MLGEDFSLVVFDDSSTDKTPEIILENNVNSVRIRKSFGLGHVFSCIMKYFLENNFDILVTIDGDGQFDAKDIKKIINPIKKGEAQMVTGSRFMPGSTTKDISWIKKIGNKLGASYISSVLQDKYNDVTCGFRAYTKEAILKLHTFSNFTYTQEVFLNLGFKKVPIKEVPITTIYLKERKSKMTKSIFRYIFESIKIIVKSMLVYSPMRLFGKISFAFFTVSAVTGISVFMWDKIHGTATPFKWLALTSLVCILISILSYSLGILLQITSRLQLTVEEELYYQKKNLFK